MLALEIQIWDLSAYRSSVKSGSEWWHSGEWTEWKENRAQDRTLRSTRSYSVDRVLPIWVQIRMGRGHFPSPLILHQNHLTSPSNEHFKNLLSLRLWSFSALRSPFFFSSRYLPPPLAPFQLVKFCVRALPNGTFYNDGNILYLYFIRW